MSRSFLFNETKICQIVQKVYTREMQAVYSALRSGIESAKSDTDTAKVLLDFQKSISPSTCGDISRKELTDWFTKLWDILLGCLSSESTVVRISTYSAASAFLVKMTPYFPKYMISAFSLIASRDVYTMNHSVILVSAFAFLTNFLNLSVLDDFLQNTPIFHRFVGADSLDSEYLSHIIANLGDIGTNWFQSLLAALIRRNGKNPSRSVMKAICSVIARDPETMIAYLVSLNVRDMVLIAYIVRSLGDKMRHVEMYQFALLAMDVLRNHTASAAAVDAENACRILAARSMSFDLNLTVLDDDKIELVVERRSLEGGTIEAKRNGMPLEEIYKRFDEEEKKLTKEDFEAEKVATPLEGESDSGMTRSLSRSSRSSGRILDLMSYGSNVSEDFLWLRDAGVGMEAEPQIETEPVTELREKESAVLSVSLFKGTPGFYLLPLPMKPFLVPDKNDSASVLVAKMTNIALQISDENEIQDIEEKIKFLDQYSQGGYDNVVSACLQSLTLCVNSLIMNTTSSVLPQMLRRLLFANTVSWFHASDILRVVQAIRVDLIPMLFGKNSLKELLELLLGFAMNPNSQLRGESRKVIHDMVTKDNVDSVIQIVIANIDYYLPMSLQVHLGILTDVMRRFKDTRLDMINFVSHLIFEVSDFYADDIYTMSSILEFMSLIDLKAHEVSEIVPLLNFATPIVRAGISFLTGWTCRSEWLPYYEMISRFVTSNSVEIISEGAHVYRERYRCIYAAVVFLLALPKNLVDMRVHQEICERLYRFFPDEITDYLLYKQKRIQAKKRIKMIDRHISKLDFVKSSSVHAKWCEIFVRNSESLMTPELSRCIEKLLRTALWYMDNPSKASVGELVQFAQFIVEKDRANYKVVLKMVYSLSEEQQQEFFDHGVVRFVRFRKWFPSIRKEAFWDQFAYLLPRQKDTVLDDICNLPAPTIVNEDVIEYGNKKLKGWKLMFFKRNTDQEMEKLEYRPFNPFFADDEVPIEQRLRSLIESGNPGEVSSLLDRIEHLDLTNICVSPEHFDTVLLWLRKQRKRTIIRSLIKNFHVADLNKSRRGPAVTAMLCDPNRFLLEFIECPKLSKLQICWLIYGLQSMSRNEQMICALVIRMFEDIKSTKRMAVVMRLTEVFLERSSSISQQFSKVFCDCIQSKSPDLFTADIMKVTSKLRLRSKFDEEQDALVQMLLKTFTPFTPHYFLLFGGTAPEVSAILPDLLASDLPSVSEKWFTALRFFAKLDEKTAVQYCSNFLPQVYECVLKHQHNFRVNERFLFLLKSLLTAPRIAQLYGDIIDKFFTTLLPEPDRAHYPKLLSLIPSILAVITDESPAMGYVNEIEEKLSRVCDSLEMFKVYIAILQWKLRKEVNLEVRQQEIENTILVWLEQRSSFDSYYYQFFVKEWIQMMRDFSPLKSMLILLLFHFMKQPTRAFPFIAALVPLLQKIMVFASEEDREWIKSKLAEAQAIPTDPRAVQALALAADGKYREAIAAVVE